MSNVNVTSAQGAAATCARRGVKLAIGVALVGALAGMNGLANAQSAAGPVTAPTDDSLTYKGVTLYGTIDIGLQFDEHAAPFSDFYFASSNDVVQKNSNHSAFGLTSNNMGQSRVGLAVLEPLGVGDWYAIGRVETYFNPSSGDISDALKSITQNNGRALTAQTTNIDSSIAGELFEQAYLGVSSATFGAVTFGRQNTLLADGVAKYDPNGASNAFSLIGFSGTTAGGGDTQDRRLDDTIKYSEVIGPVHVGGLYKFSQAFGAANTAEQFNLGFDYAGLSVDAYYAHIRDAVSASALSAAQLAIAVAAPNYLSPNNSVAATISDNQSESIFALYNLGFVPAKLYAGYEHIQFGNPKNPLAIGFDDIGGYKLGAVNNANFPHEKTLDIYWGGVRYTIFNQLDLTAAFYGITQNSYGVGAAAGCSNTSAGTCRGTESVYSADADYRWTKRFDTYAGIMYSSVSDGLANGFLKTTNANPTIGFRFRF